MTNATGMIAIETENQLNDLIQSNPGVLVYFSAPACNVCKVLKPKIEEMCVADYPDLPLAYVDCDAMKETAGQNRVFTIPVVIVFFDGKETVRKTRTFGIGELSEAISRPYSMLF